MRQPGLAIAIILAACKQGGGGDYPINPGGDDVGDFFPQPDGPPADQALGDANAMITGRVCLLGDVRVPASCAATGAGGITVVLGTASATTADDGMFSLVSPGGTNLVWLAGAAGLVTSVVPVSTSNILPVLTAADYDDMLATNGVILNADQSSIILYVRDATGPLAGAGVTVSPPATFPSMHDTANKSVWVAGDTGTIGVSWTPGVNTLPGVASVTVGPPAGAAQQFTLPVQDGTITFATVAF